MIDTPPPLNALRRDIDRIDEAMHRLLIERGDFISFDEWQNSVGLGDH